MTIKKITPIHTLLINVLMVKLNLREVIQHTHTQREDFECRFYFIRLVPADNKKLKMDFGVWLYEKKKCNLLLVINE